MTDELRASGFSVALTHTLGQGFPDMVVGFGNYNLLVEIKDPEKPPSQRKLTPDEEEWHANWKGCVIVAEHSADVIEHFSNIFFQG